MSLKAMEALKEEAATELPKLKRQLKTK